MRAAAKQARPYYLLLLPALPVIQLAATNASRVEPLDALIVYLMLAGGCVLVALVLRWIFRRPDVTDLVTALLFGVTFLPAVFIVSEGYRLIWAVVWFLALLLVLRFGEARRIAAVLLSVGSAAFGAVLLNAALSSGVSAQSSAFAGVAEKAFPELPVATSEAAEKPDIYYFIFDRYARADFMKSIYGHDNEPFLEELRKRGFYVAEESFANYQRTAHSIVSSLNFDYLDGLSTDATKDLSDWRLIFSMFQDFRIARFLKGEGYEFHYAGTWWEPTRRIAAADVHHNHFEMRELLLAVYQSSMAAHASRSIGFGWGDPLFWQCRRSRLMFEDIRSQAPGDRPRFYFAHFLIPHPPFVTHESGRCMDIAEARSRSRSKNYVGQVTYANRQILETVDAILSRPGPRPIIILQADEGPWPGMYAGDEVTSFARDVTRVEWTKVPPELLREKFAILNAVYAPGIPPSEFSPGMTPVNVFRKVLRSVFNVPIEDLPDRMKIYLDNDHIYEFQDVTDSLRGP